MDREPDDSNNNESLLATGSGAPRPAVRFGNCPVCKMVASGDECITCLKNEVAVLRVFLSFQKHVGSGDCYLSRGERFWTIEWITTGSHWSHQWMFTDTAALEGADDLGRGAAGIAKEEFRVALQKQEKRDHED